MADIDFMLVQNNVCLPEPFDDGALVPDIVDKENHLGVAETVRDCPVVEGAAPQGTFAKLSVNTIQLDATPLKSVFIETGLRSIQGDVDRMLTQGLIDYGAPPTHPYLRRSMLVTLARDMSGNNVSVLGATHWRPSTGEMKDRRKDLHSLHQGALSKLLKPCLVSTEHHYASTKDSKPHR